MGVMLLNRLMRDALVGTSMDPLDHCRNVDARFMFCDEVALLSDPSGQPFRPKGLG